MESKMTNLEAQVKSKKKTHETKTNPKTVNHSMNEQEMQKQKNTGNDEKEQTDPPH